MTDGQIPFDELASLLALLAEHDRAPRLALRVTEAAVSLGVSLDFFDEHVAPELRIVRKGRVKLVQVAELEAWLDRNAALAVDRGAR